MANLAAFENTAHLGAGGSLLASILSQQAGPQWAPELGVNALDASQFGSLAELTGSQAFKDHVGAATNILSTTRLGDPSWVNPAYGGPAASPEGWTTYGSGLSHIKNYDELRQFWDTVPQGTRDLAMSWFAKNPERDRASWPDRFEALDWAMRDEQRQIAHPDGGFGIGDILGLAAGPIAGLLLGPVGGAVVGGLAGGVKGGPLGALTGAAGGYFGGGGQVPGLDKITSLFTGSGGAAGSGTVGLSTTAGTALNAALPGHFALGTPLAAAGTGVGGLGVATGLAGFGAAGTAAAKLFGGVPLSNTAGRALNEALPGTFGVGTPGINAGTGAGGIGVATPLAGLGSGGSVVGDSAIAALLKKGGTSLLKEAGGSLLNRVLGLDAQDAGDVLATGGGSGEIVDGGALINAMTGGGLTPAMETFFTPMASSGSSGGNSRYSVYRNQLPGFFDA